MDTTKRVLDLRDKPKTKTGPKTVTILLSDAIALTEYHQFSIQQRDTIPLPVRSALISLAIQVHKAENSEE